MAFNFNWSPLMADTSKAREMLTAALNKSPKPPIIVDDIIVTELNLGSTPPELDILEIGDLAEDKFRGIFKMSYTGDAFLTLKTRVQANPLNTYLTEKPTFSSPQPLAAASGLTIPLQITLSDIRLSGFVILVFSRQKGLTIVFRNDPLESLKVSSTFDSIPFVRDYLQKEIEAQLRVLFMEDLPAILHRLSLRLWSSDYDELEDESRAQGPKSDTAPIDPLASSGEDVTDVFGNPIDGEYTGFPFNSNSEAHTSFSAKNLLRLAALTESQRTLSLFTPSIRDAVFRAWAGNNDRHERSADHGPSLTLKSLSRMHSSASAPSSAPSVDGGSDNGTILSRNSWSSTGSSYQNLGIGNGRSRAHPSRKAKKRVIDLRGSNGETNSAPEEEGEAPVPATIVTDDSRSLPERPHVDTLSPPRTPPRGMRLRNRRDALEVEDSGLTPIREEKTPLRNRTMQHSSRTSPQDSSKPATQETRPSRPTHSRFSQSTSTLPLLRSVSLDKMPFYHNGASSPPQPFSQPHALYSPFVPYSPAEQASAAGSSGGILEQAWMLKMAKEIARKVAEEKERSAADAQRAPGEHSRVATHPSSSGGIKASDGLWEGEGEIDAPPAYAA